MNRVPIAASRRVHRVHVQQCGGLRITLLRTSRNSGNENNEYCTRFCFLQLAVPQVNSNYHEQISIHDQLIVRISRNLRLCYSTRDDATVCNSSRHRQTDAVFRRGQSRDHRHSIVTTRAMPRKTYGNSARQVTRASTQIAGSTAVVVAVAVVDESAEAAIK